MTPRQKALAVSSPALALLIATAVWNLAELVVQRVKARTF